MPVSTSIPRRDILKIRKQLYPRSTHRVDLFNITEEKQIAGLPSVKPPGLVMSALEPGSLDAPYRLVEVA